MEFSLKYALNGREVKAILMQRLVKVDGKVRFPGISPRAYEHPADAHRVDSLAMFHASIGDGKEGVAAFLDKRTPVYSDKASQMPPFYGAW